MAESEAKNPKSGVLRMRRDYGGDRTGTGKKDSAMMKMLPPIEDYDHPVMEETVTDKGKKVGPVSDIPNKTVFIVIPGDDYDSAPEQGPMDSKIVDLGALKAEGESEDDDVGAVAEMIKPNAPAAEVIETDEDEDEKSDEESEDSDDDDSEEDEEDEDEKGHEDKGHGEKGKGCGMKCPMCGKPHSVREAALKECKTLTCPDCKATFSTKAIVKTASGGYRVVTATVVDPAYGHLQNVIKKASKEKLSEEDIKTASSALNFLYDKAKKK